ncbi:MAG: hypothetical protein C4551_00715 [Bacillota bacterium]|nr:MAG: hypothetical protein C4551_00715 [Bacillota bacterium]
MRKGLGFLLVAWGLGMVAYGLSGMASAAVGTLGVSFTNPDIEELTVAPASIDFGAITPGTPTASGANEVDVTVRVNGRTWDLDCSAADFSDGAGKTIPIGRLSDDGGTTPFAGKKIEDNHAAGSVTVTYDFVLGVLWTDPSSADPFTTTITYTLTPNP